MINSTYIGLSAQLALQRRLDTIANNVANSGSTGFRSEQVRFVTADSAEAMPEARFAATGLTYLSRKVGEIAATGSALDVAVDGDAWLAVQTQQGIAYSRDGRLTITPEGNLMTVTGHPVLDVSGSPIRLDPAAGTPGIARDGTITQGTRNVGTIGLFTIDPSARLSRGIDSTVLTDIPAEPSVDNPVVGLRQGYVEHSNVDPVTEMSRLILDQRMFEAVTGVLGEIEQTRQDSIRNLASTT